MRPQRDIPVDKNVDSAARLLLATDDKIEETAMWLMVGYCIRISEHKAVKKEYREDWLKLATKVQAICELRYGKISEHFGDKIQAREETKANDGTNSTIHKRSTDYNSLIKPGDNGTNEG